MPRSQLATDIGDTVKRIDGTEVPLTRPGRAVKVQRPATPGNVGPATAKAHEPRPGKGRKADATGAAEQEAPETAKGSPERHPAAPASGSGGRPAALTAARGGKPDDLKLIKGVGPKLEALLTPARVFPLRSGGGLDGGRGGLGR